MTDPHDLDALLTPPAAAPDPARRAALFAATAARLRWAARIRRLTKAVAVVAVFTAGAGIGWVTKPTPAPAVERELIPVPVPLLLAEEPQSIGPFVELSPSRLELEAEKATDRSASAKLYRQAGDAYLARTEIESAVRCYRNHLAEAGADGLGVSADDSWLLTSIKNAHQRRDGS